MEHNNIGYNFNGAIGHQHQYQHQHQQHHSQHQPQQQQGGSMMAGLPLENHSYPNYQSYNQMEQMKMQEYHTDYGQPQHDSNMPSTSQMGYGMYPMYQEEYAMPQQQQYSQQAMNSWQMTSHPSTSQQDPNQQQIQQYMANQAQPNTTVMHGYHNHMIQGYQHQQQQQNQMMMRAEIGQNIHPMPTTSCMYPMGRSVHGMTNYPVEHPGIQIQQGYPGTHMEPAQATLKQRRVEEHQRQEQMMHPNSSWHYNNQLTFEQQPQVFSQQSHNVPASHQHHDAPTALTQFQKTPVAKPSFQAQPQSIPPSHDALLFDAPEVYLEGRNQMCYNIPSEIPVDGYRNITPAFTGYPQLAAGKENTKKPQVRQTKPVAVNPQAPEPTQFQEHIQRIEFFEQECHHPFVSNFTHSQQQEADCQHVSTVSKLDTGEQMMALSSPGKELPARNNNNNIINSKFAALTLDIQTTKATNKPSSKTVTLKFQPLSLNACSSTNSSLPKRKSQPKTVHSSRWTEIRQLAMMAPTPAKSRSVPPTETLHKTSLAPTSHLINKTTAENLLPNSQQIEEVTLSLTAEKERSESPVLDADIKPRGPLRKDHSAHMGLDHDFSRRLEEYRDYDVVDLIGETSYQFSEQPAIEYESNEMIEDMPDFDYLTRILSSGSESATNYELQMSTTPPPSSFNVALNASFSQPSSRVQSPLKNTYIGSPAYPDSDKTYGGSPENIQKLKREKNKKIEVEEHQKVLDPSTSSLGWIPPRCAASKAKLKLGNLWDGEDEEQVEKPRKSRRGRSKKTDDSDEDDPAYIGSQRGTSRKGRHGISKPAASDKKKGRRGRPPKNPKATQMSIEDPTMSQQFELSPQSNCNKSTTSNKSNMNAEEGISQYQPLNIHIPESQPVDNESSITPDFGTSLSSVLDLNATPVSNLSLMSSWKSPIPSSSMKVDGTKMNLPITLSSWDPPKTPDFENTEPCEELLLSDDEQQNEPSLSDYPEIPPTPGKGLFDSPSSSYNNHELQTYNSTPHEFSASWLSSPTQEPSFSSTALSTSRKISETLILTNKQREIRTISSDSEEELIIIRKKNEKIDEDEEVKRRRSNEETFKYSQEEKKKAKKEEKKAKKEKKRQHEKEDEDERKRRKELKRQKKLEKKKAKGNILSELIEAKPNFSELFGEEPQSIKSKKFPGPSIATSLRNNDKTVSSKYASTKQKLEELVCISNPSKERKRDISNESKTKHQSNPKRGPTEKPKVSPIDDSLKIVKSWSKDKSKVLPLVDSSKRARRSKSKEIRKSSINQRGAYTVNKEKNKKLKDLELFNHRKREEQQRNIVKNWAVRLDPEDFNFKPLQDGFRIPKLNKEDKKRKEEERRKLEVEMKATLKNEDARRTKETEISASTNIGTSSSTPSILKLPTIFAATKQSSISSSSPTKSTYQEIKKKVEVKKNIKREKTDANDIVGNILDKMNKQAEHQKKKEHDVHRSLEKKDKTAQKISTLQEMSSEQPKAPSISLPPSNRNTSPTKINDRLSRFSTWTPNTNKQERLRDAPKVYTNEPIGVIPNPKLGSQKLQAQTQQPSNFAPLAQFRFHQFSSFLGSLVTNTGQVLQNEARKWAIKSEKSENVAVVEYSSVEDKEYQQKNKEPVVDVASAEKINEQTPPPMRSFTCLSRTDSDEIPIKDPLLSEARNPSPDLVLPESYYPPEYSPTEDFLKALNISSTAYDIEKIDMTAAVVSTSPSNTQYHLGQASDVDLSLSFDQSTDFTQMPIESFYKPFDDFNQAEDPFAISSILVEKDDKIREALMTEHPENEKRPEEEVVEKIEGPSATSLSEFPKTTNDYDVIYEYFPGLLNRRENSVMHSEIPIDQIAPHEQINIEREDNSITISETSTAYQAELPWTQYNEFFELNEVDEEENHEHEEEEIDLEDEQESEEEEEPIPPLKPLTPIIRLAPIIPLSIDEEARIAAAAITSPEYENTGPSECRLFEEDEEPIPEYPVNIPSQHSVLLQLDHTIQKEKVQKIEHKEVSEKSSIVAKETINEKEIVIEFNQPETAQITEPLIVEQGKKEQPMKTKIDKVEKQQNCLNESTTLEDEMRPNDEVAVFQPTLKKAEGLIKEIEAPKELLLSIKQGKTFEPHDDDEKVVEISPIMTVDQNKKDEYDRHQEKSIEEVACKVKELEKTIIQGVFLFDEISARNISVEQEQGTVETILKMLKTLKITQNKLTIVEKLETKVAHETVPNSQDKASSSEAIATEKSQKLLQKHLEIFPQPQLEVIEKAVEEIRTEKKEIVSGPHMSDEVAQKTDDLEVVLGNINREVDEEETMTRKEQEKHISENDEQPLISAEQELLPKQILSLSEEIPKLPFQPSTKCDRKTRARVSSESDEKVTPDVASSDDEEVKLISRTKFEKKFGKGTSLDLEYANIAQHRSVHYLIEEEKKPMTRSKTNSAQEFEKPEPSISGIWTTSTKEDEEEQRNPIDRKIRQFSLENEKEAVVVHPSIDPGDKEKEKRLRERAIENGQTAWFFSDDDGERHAVNDAEAQIGRIQELEKISEILSIPMNLLQRMDEKELKNLRIVAANPSGFNQVKKPETVLGFYYRKERQDYKKKREACQSLEVKICLKEKLPIELDVEPETKKSSMKGAFPQVVNVAAGQDELSYAVQEKEDQVTILQEEMTQEEAVRMPKEIERLPERKESSTKDVPVSRMVEGQEKQFETAAKNEHLDQNAFITEERQISAAHDEKEQTPIAQLTMDQTTIVEKNLLKIVVDSPSIKGIEAVAVGTEKQQQEVGCDSLTQERHKMLEEIEQKLGISMDILIGLPPNEIKNAYAATTNPARYFKVKNPYSCLGYYFRKERMDYRMKREAQQFAKDDDQVSRTMEDASIAAQVIQKGELVNERVDLGLLKSSSFRTRRTFVRVDVPRYDDCNLEPEAEDESDNESERYVETANENYPDVMNKALIDARTSRVKKRKAASYSFNTRKIKKKRAGIEEIRVKKGKWTEENIQEDAGQEQDVSAPIIVKGTNNGVDAVIGKRILESLAIDRESWSPELGGPAEIVNHAEIEEAEIITPQNIPVADEIRADLEKYPEAQLNKLEIEKELGGRTELIISSRETTPENSKRSMTAQCPVENLQHKNNADVSEVIRFDSVLSDNESEQYSPELGEVSYRPAAKPAVEIPQQFEEDVALEIIYAKAQKEPVSTEQQTILQQSVTNDYDLIDVLQPGRPVEYSAEEFIERKLQMSEFFEKYYFKFTKDNPYLLSIPTCPPPGVHRPAPNCEANKFVNQLSTSSDGEATKWLDQTQTSEITSNACSAFLRIETIRPSTAKSATQYFDFTENQLTSTDYAVHQPEKNKVEAFDEISRSLIMSDGIYLGYNNYTQEKHHNSMNPSSYQIPDPSEYDPVDNIYEEYKEHSMRHAVKSNGKNYVVYITQASKGFCSVRQIFDEVMSHDGDVANFLLGDVHVDEYSFYKEKVFYRFIKMCAFAVQDPTYYIVPMQIRIPRETTAYYLDPHQAVDYEWHYKCICQERAIPLLVKTLELIRVDKYLFKALKRFVNTREYLNEDQSTGIWHNYKMVIEREYKLPAIAYYGRIEINCGVDRACPESWNHGLRRIYHHRLALFKYELQVWMRLYKVTWERHSIKLQDIPKHWFHLRLCHPALPTRHSSIPLQKNQFNYNMQGDETKHEKEEKDIIQPFRNMVAHDEQFGEDWPNIEFFKEKGLTSRLVDFVYAANNIYCQLEKEYTEEFHDRFRTAYPRNVVVSSTNQPQ